MTTPLTRSASPPKTRILIKLNQNEQKLDIDILGNEGYIIGRSDNKSNYVPDIDLAVYSALDKGVSRRHAALVHYQDRLHVLDLSSVNGTFLNGTRLLPETPHPLSAGDTITLGNLNLVIMSME